jgi:hypothetical protein
MLLVEIITPSLERLALIYMYVIGTLNSSGIKK